MLRTLERGYSDPPRRMLRYDGQPAIGIGISTVHGGNVVRMGEGVRAKLAELKRDQPIGIEIGEINFQPEAVSAGDERVRVQPAQGGDDRRGRAALRDGPQDRLDHRPGAVPHDHGDVPRDVHEGRFADGAHLARRADHRPLHAHRQRDHHHRRSQGRHRGGRRQARSRARRRRPEPMAAVRGHRDRRYRFRGDRAVGRPHGRVLQFAVLGDSDFAELELGLVGHGHAALQLPVLQAFAGRARQANSAILTMASSFACIATCCASALRFRWLGGDRCRPCMFVLSLWGFTKIDQSFFPPATRPQFMVDVFLPASTHIRETEAFAADVEKFIQEQPGVTHVTSFIGGGGLRFLLVYIPEMENRAFVQFLVDVDDRSKIDGVIADVQQHLDKQHPNANAVAKKFLLGPGDGGRIQARFRGPDPAKLRRTGGNKPCRFLKTTAARSACGTIGASAKWRFAHAASNRRPVATASRASRWRRRSKPASKVASSVSIANRATPAAARERIPQETRLLPIIARPPIDERGDVAAINSMQIWSPVAGRMIPLQPSRRRREHRLGRSGRRAPQSLPHAHRPRRPTHRLAEPVVQPRARSNRSDRTARRATRWNGAASTKIRATPAPPSRSRFRSHWRSWCSSSSACSIRSAPRADLADHAAGDHRRDVGPAAHRHSVRLHGPAWACSPWAAN